MCMLSIIVSIIMIQLTEGAPPPAPANNNIEHRKRVVECTCYMLYKKTDIEYGIWHMAYGIGE
jgi:hypothetical protein